MHAHAHARVRRTGGAWFAAPQTVTHGFSTTFIFQLSARNRLNGKISRIQTGAVNTDISIALPGGAVLSAVITNESCAEMGLKKGQKVTGLFKASAVILGVPA